MKPSEIHSAESPVAPPKELKCCPVDNTFKIIGKKFTILILRNMIYSKQKRFNEFLNTIEEINPNTLSTRLREMEKDEIIERVILPETPVRIEYHLSEKGKDLFPILEQMAAFSMKHSPGIFTNGKPRCFQKVMQRDPATL